MSFDYCNSNQLQSIPTSTYSPWTVDCFNYSPLNKDRSISLFNTITIPSHPLQYSPPLNPSQPMDPIPCYEPPYYLGYSSLSSPTEYEFSPLTLPSVHHNQLYSLSSSFEILDPIVLKSNTNEDINQLFHNNYPIKTKQKKISSIEDSSQAKHKRNLERNRESTRRCRQRQQAKLQELLHRVRFLTDENTQLQEEAIHLKEQMVDIKLMLFNIHRHNCPMKPNSI